MTEPCAYVWPPARVRHVDVYAGNSPSIAFDFRTEPVDRSEWVKSLCLLGQKPCLYSERCSLPEIERYINFIWIAF